MSEKIDGGGQAFPGKGWDEGEEFAIRGMSLRDWFAGQAILRAGDFIPGPGPERIAERAYAVADALLSERKKPRE